MGNLGSLHQLIVSFMGIDWVFNLEVILYTWVAILLLLIMGFIAARVQGNLQTIGEVLITKLYELTKDSMGEELAKKYFPLVFGLFVFLLISNWIGIIPHMEEPTKDLNTTLSLGVLGFLIAHYTGIKTKGLKKYLSSYLEPMFFMAPLNLISEVSRVISISFRIFGNIMGGSIIILVISYLTYSLILPPFLYAFFGLFVGTIQAFVFTMLTITYIADQAK